MFEQSLVESGHAAGARKPAAILASVGVQAAALLAVAIAPLMHYQLLPSLGLATRLDAPAPLAAAPATSPAPHVTRLASYAWSLATPTPAPLPSPAAAPAAAAPLLAPIAVGGATVPDINADVDIAVAGPPPTRATTPPQPAARLSVGGAIQAARCLACAPPAYPAFARQAHLEGTVELHALIGADGTIEHLDRLSGNAVLAAAAMRAVRAWRYQPLLLNGQAMEVETVITVKFLLGGS